MIEILITLLQQKSGDYYNQNLQKKQKFIDQNGVRKKSPREGSGVGLGLG